MTFKELTRAIAYHTQEDRLGSYFKSIASSIAIAICFMYALGQTVRASINQMTYVTLMTIKAAQGASQSAYRAIKTITHRVSSNYYSFPTYNLEKEQVVTQASAG